MPDYERQQWEEVFGLTGGELETKPWECVANYDGQGHVSQRKYWYEGAPDYAEREYRNETRELRTVCTDSLVYGQPPSALFDERGMWSLIETWSSSGEVECPYCHAERDEQWAGIDFHDNCPLCECSREEGHGYVYLGDGCAELLYRLDCPAPNIREFSKHDWMGWAGASRFASGGEPLMATGELPDVGKGVEFTLVLSGGGSELSVYFDASGEQDVYSLDTHFETQASARAWAHSVLCCGCRVEDFLKVGFTKL